MKVYVVTNAKIDSAYKNPKTAERALIARGYKLVDGFWSMDGEQDFENDLMIEERELQ